jgi:hypothetical protein
MIRTTASILDADVSIWLGSSRTTQIGSQNIAIAYEVEARFRGRETFSYSVAFLSEGDTNLVNRRGAVARRRSYRTTCRRRWHWGVLAYDGDHAGKGRHTGGCKCESKPRTVQNPAASLRGRPYVYPSRILLQQRSGHLHDWPSRAAVIATGTKASRRDMIWRGV